MSDDTRQQNQNQTQSQTARQPTVGSIKAPGTYEKVTVKSGVVGKGGGIINNSPSSQQAQSPAPQPTSPSQGQSPAQSNKLSDVLKPPKTALTPSLPKATYSTGYNVMPSSTSQTSTSQASQPTSSSQGKSSVQIATLGINPSTNIFNVLQTQSKSQPQSQESKYASAYYGEKSDSYFIGSGGSIEPFQRNQPPPLSRYEADAMPKGIIGRVKYWWETRDSSISPPVGETTKFKVYPTGTTLNLFETTYKKENFVPSIVPEKTGRKLTEEEFVIYDVGTPTEYKLDYLSKDLEKQYTKKQESFIQSKEEQATSLFKETQENINQGRDFEIQKVLYDMKLKDLNEDVSKYNTQLSKEFQSEFESKGESLIKSDLGRKEQVLGRLEAGRKQVQFEPILETTALVVLPGSAGLKSLQVSSGLLATFGAKDIIQGTYRDDKMQIAEGVVKGLFAGSIVTSKAFAESLQMQSVEKSLKGLSKQSFVGYESRQLGISDTSRVIGKRGFDSFEQTIKSSGEVFKIGKNQFMMPEGKLIAETTGKIPSRAGLGGFGKEVPAKFYYASQGYDIGTKGFTYSIGESGKNFLSVGSGSLVKRFETSALLNLKETKVIPKVTETLYHGTTDKYTKDILSKGLQSGQSTGVSQRFDNLKLEGVFTTKQKDWATSWANMASYGKGTKVGSPNVFEINMPKSVYNKNLIQRGIEKGGSDEFIFKEVGSKYIKGYYDSSGSFIKNPSFDISRKALTFNKKELASQLKSNLKLFEGTEYTKSGLIGVTKKVDKSFFVSRIGTVNKLDYNPTQNFEYLSNKEGVKSFSQTFEGVKIDATLKDYILTKTTKKTGTTKTFEIIDSGGSDLGLKQFKQTISLNPKLASQTIERGLVQEFKSEFKPSLLTKSSSSTIQELSKTSSIGLIKPSTKTTQSFQGQLEKPQTKLKSSTIQSSAFSPASIQDTSQFSTSSFGLSSMSALSSSQSLKQPQALATPQISKSDLTSRQIQRQTSAFSNFNLPPSGTGFSFGGASLPPFIPPILNLGGGSGAGGGSRRKKKKKGLVAPSLTAEVFDLTGSFPKGSSYGLTPFQFRTKPNSRKRKKK